MWRQAARQSAQSLSKDPVVAFRLESETYLITDYMTAGLKPTHRKSSNEVRLAFQTESDNRIFSIMIELIGEPPGAKTSPSSIGVKYILPSA